MTFDCGSPILRTRPNVCQRSTGPSSVSRPPTGHGEPLLGSAQSPRGPLRASGYNLTISNVPCPDVPPYMLGAELVEAHPVVPSPRPRACDRIVRYRDRLHFGLFADPDAQLAEAAVAASALGGPLGVPDPVERLREETLELLEARAL
jgi:hypothetical protein